MKILTCAWFSATAHAQETSLPVDATQLLNQRIYGDQVNTCGPAAFFHSIKFGDEATRAKYRGLLGQNKQTRFRYIIDRYFLTRPSEVAKGQKRLGAHGTFVQDLNKSCEDFFSEVDLPKSYAEFLDRKNRETDEEFVERIHEYIADSISAGMPPILSLRSFVVRHREENNRAPKWETSYHHYVTIYSVPEKLPQGAKGFTAQIIDSSGPALRTIHIHAEPNGQAFSALKGNEIKGKWLTGREFLLVNTPGMFALRPANLKWSERYIVTAHFLIGRF